MIDQDDWQLGDDAEGSLCSACGNRNRPGQSRCLVCGARQVAAPGADADQLRTLGEVMAGDRFADGRRPRARSGAWRWSWPVVAVGLLVVSFATYQIAMRSLPRWVGRDTTRPPGAGSATGGVARETGLGEAKAPLTDQTPAADVMPVVVRATSMPSAAGVPEVVKAPQPGREPAPVRRPGAAAESGAATPGGPGGERDRRERAALAEKDRPVAPARIRSRPLREKPSLGTDLVEARRAYAAGIENYNGRADAYNAIADAYQRAEARADEREMAQLRRQLERARQAAERARAEAETMRRRMEEVQARYR